jgi:excisionase family DNA binding protein
MVARERVAMTEDFNPTEWITTGEAADLTGYTTAYFRQLIKRGRLKARKRGRDWFLNKAEVLAYAEEMRRLGQDKFNPWRTGARQ